MYNLHEEVRRICFTRRQETGFEDLFIRERYFGMKLILWTFELSEKKTCLLFRRLEENEIKRTLRNESAFAQFGRRHFPDGGGSHSVTSAFTFEIRKTELGFSSLLPIKIKHRKRLDVQ